MFLITGSSGFLGRALVERVKFRLRRGDKNARYFPFDLPFHSILDPDPDAPIANANAREKGFDSSLHELRHKAGLAGVVIHAAAMADLNHAAADHDKARRLNIEGTANVAKVCKEAGALMVYVSTCCVYGNVEGVRREDGPVAPTEIYAETKLRGERILQTIPGLRWRIVRLGTFYGPGMRAALFNRVALEAVALRRPLEIHGDGTQTRQYVYSDDIAEAVMMVAESGRDGTIYNAAGPERVSVLDTIKCAVRIGNRVGWPGCPGWQFIKDRGGQILSEDVDSSRLAMLGWKPQKTYESGMLETARWLDAQIKGGKIK